MTRPLGIGILALAGYWAFPCAPAPPQTQLPAPDYACYVNAVEPELLARCAYSACHGMPERPLHLYAPAGRRLRPNLPPNNLVDEEQRANYDSVRVFAAKTSADLPDLLRKPLQLSAGGAGHGGVDRFGANAYASKEDPGYKVLADWVGGQLVGCPPRDYGLDGGSVPSSCAQTPYSYQANIAPIVNPTRCAEALCHTPENVATGDAGCFLPDTCQAVLASGCARRSVIPCAPRLSKLYLYTGVLPYKAHQGKLTSANRDAIGAWIDAGAPCD